MTRFFVSYSRTVQEEVEKIVRLLRAAPQHEVWWDGDIFPGQDWWATILDHIEWCDVFLFAVSERSVQSVYCLAELDYATNRNRPILPFVMDDNTKYTIPPAVIRNQWFAHDGNPGLSLDRIVGACEKLDWSKHVDIPVQRPSEPNTRVGSVVTQFQQAVTLAEDAQFEEALKRFRNIASLDRREWGTACGEWERCIQSYRFIGELAQHHSTYSRAYTAWRAHVDKHKAEFDPLDLATKLIEPPPDDPDLEENSAEDIYVLMDRFYAAYSTQNWIAAFELLDIIDGRNDVPSMFKSAGYRAITEKTSANTSAAAQEYLVLKLMAKYESRAHMQATLLQFRQEFPDYDPDDLWEQFRPQVTDVLPEPFEWCNVPAGEFMMGHEDEVENPPRPVYLPAFAIAKYPITYRQFQVFIDSGGFIDQRWWDGLSGESQVAKPGDQQWKINDYPRENVSWYEAVAFCRWLSFRLGGGYIIDGIEKWAVRLPTEFEWEKAARGTDGRLYPWGDEFDEARCNIAQSGVGMTTPVIQYPQGVSPYGVLDMSGNISEWCLSSYTYPTTEARLENICSNARRVVRGGSWDNFDDKARAVYRYFSDPEHRSSNCGFRVILCSRSSC